MVKVRFAADETGWARRLPDGTYRIANIPLAEHLNLDDVVSVRAGEDDFAFPVVDEVLKKGLAGKAAVRYGTADQFVAFARQAREQGACVEGLVGPRGDMTGLALVAYPEGFDLKALARRHRVVVEE
jgi:hypothetical protein